jgi:hypothetical protein
MIRYGVVLPRGELRWLAHEPGPPLTKETGRPAFKTSAPRSVSRTQSINSTENRNELLPAIWRGITLGPRHISKFLPLALEQLLGRGHDLFP